MIIAWVWSSNKKMRECPFCGKKNTYCTIETTNIKTIDDKPVLNAVITCHICGCTVHDLNVDKDAAIKVATYKWEHRADDENDQRTQDMHKTE